MTSVLLVMIVFVGRRDAGSWVCTNERCDVAATVSVTRAECIYVVESQTALVSALKPLQLEVLPRRERHSSQQGFPYVYQEKLVKK